MNPTTSDALVLYHHIRGQQRPDKRLTVQLNSIINSLITSRESQDGSIYINRLPAELLGFIFQKAVEDDPAMPLILLLVSQTWRRVAEQEPKLWSNIILAGYHPGFFELAAREKYSPSYS